MAINKLKVVNEILDLIHDHGVGDELGEAYQEGYCDAVDDIYNMIVDYFEQTSTWKHDRCRQWFSVIDIDTDDHISTIWFTSNYIW